ncbi:MAG: fimbrillin family protein [Bacteroidales bacterium]|nr:fimbrillin family protein [Candidatus Liminaster caballi]
MKKILFVAATAALVLSSCSNEISESFQTKKSDRTALEVKAYMPGMTRAAVVADFETLTANGFRLVATSENEQFDPINELYAYDEGNKSWTANGTFYWPIDPTAVVSFVGVYDPTGTYEGGETIDVTTTSNDDEECANDYLVAKKDLSLATSNGGAVTLQFKHILAEVQVEVMGNSDITGYAYQVAPVVIKAAATGTYDIASEEFEAGELQEFKVNSAFVSSYNPQDGTYDVEYSSFDKVGTKDYTEIGNPIMIVPSDYCEISFQYVVTIEGSNERPTLKEAHAYFMPVAGSLNRLQIVLNPEKVEIKVKVDGVDEMGEETPELLDQLPW